MFLEQIPVSGKRNASRKDNEPSEIKPMYEKHTCIKYHAQTMDGVPTTFFAAKQSDEGFFVH